MKVAKPIYQEGRYRPHVLRSMYAGHISAYLLCSKLIFYRVFPTSSASGFTPDRSPVTRVVARELSSLILLSQPLFLQKIFPVGLLSSLGQQWCQVRLSNDEVTHWKILSWFYYSSRSHCCGAPFHICLPTLL